VTGWGQIAGFALWMRAGEEQRVVEAANISGHFLGFRPHRPLPNSGFHRRIFWMIDAVAAI
jgi:hypothetical protein